jgi:diadenosine tetraphosphate (Ap4A) HIT family hydrolase
METFELHPQLAADCFVVGDFPLSQLLLLNDRQYPWFILVPRVAGAREIYLLDVSDQQQLLRESAAICKMLDQELSPDKLNIAALGNMVPQLHVHHIARFESDPAWPAPVWGKMPPQPYSQNDTERVWAVCRKYLEPEGLTLSKAPVL